MSIHSKRKRRLTLPFVALSAALAALCAGAPTLAQVRPSFPFNEPFNAASHVQAQVKSLNPSDPLFHRVEVRLHPGPSGGLTANSTVWTGFLRQSGRTVTVDLGTTVTIQQLSLQFLQYVQEGVTFPQSVTYEVSSNGTAWQQAGTIQTTVPAYASGQLVQTYAVSLHNVAARYVRVEFPVSTWVMARDLRVVGSPWIPASLENLPNGNKRTPFIGPLQSGNPAAAGIHNMLLVYTGGNGAQGTWTEQTFRPMVAYLTPSGAISGTMFDSFLFLPYGTLLYNQTSWQNYLNNLFAPGQQLSALNQAVADLSGAPGGQGVIPTTAKVVLTIPYPNPKDQNFGPLPGSTQSLNFNPTSAGASASYQNRLAAMTWYVQALLKQWQSANFSHLKLAGLYWDAEAINPTAPQETTLIQQASKMTHAAGLQLFWIPTFDSTKSWADAGFDAVIMQSGYYGTPNLPLSRLSEAAAEANTLGLGLEVELGNQILTSRPYRTRYYDQLVADYNNGMEGQVVHAFYDGSQVLSQAAASKNPAVYNLYMDTHDFLLGQFTHSNYLPQNATSNP